MQGLLTTQDIKEFCRTAREQGKRIVTTNGCFDILHVGHIRSLQQSRSFGDILIVGLNSDESVKRLKGPSRPINSQDDRAEMLLALSSVDAVYIFDQDTPLEFLHLVRPDVHTKGADYKKENLAETPVVESYGGRIELLPLVSGRSTTNVVEKAGQTAKSPNC